MNVHHFADYKKLSEVKILAFKWHAKKREAKAAMKEYKCAYRQISAFKNLEDDSD